MSQPACLKVAIDARITPGLSGGVGQAVMSLIHALGKLNDGPETYTIIVGSEQQFDWLNPFVGPNQRMILKAPSPQPRTRYWLKRTLRPLARYIRSLLDANSRSWPEVPISDGFYESLGCEVLHLPKQNFTLCALPTIYNPHDLQHLHYPQFFDPWTLAWRETIYPAGCHFAHTVVVGSQWVKDDLIRHYCINPDKVQVIPENPPTQLHPEPSPEQVSLVKDKYQLEQPFALYPSVTWPHKNHIRLLEALADLRDRCGLRVRLVCTGSLYEAYWPRIEARVSELNLWPQVRFLGFVPETDLRAIYRLSQFLVQPTLFEASSLPIFEAWLEGVPVACSNVTALPDQVMDAALLFDPHNLTSLTEAIASLATDERLRQELRIRGYQRLQDFDWERTAKAYRAVYRRAAGYPLTKEDHWLLSWDWIRNPQRKREVDDNATALHSRSSSCAHRKRESLRDRLP